MSLLLIFALDFGLLVAGGAAMGYQFLHVEAYARKAGKGKAGGHSIRSIIAEADREPGNFDARILEPRPPELLFGCSLPEVEALATTWGDESKDAIGRGLRKDGHCLLAGVISAPDEMSAEDWEGMKLDAVDWLNRDGRLVSVVEHVDEAHRHIHFFKIPAAGARFETIHPGRAAALKSKAVGGGIKDQHRAYCEAMRSLQDDFFEKLGARYGLARLGPKKRRLTRSAWHHDQAAAAAAGKAMAMAERQMAEARAAMAEASGAKVEIVEAMAAAVASLDKAKAEAMGHAATAKAEAKALAVAAKAEREAASAALASASKAEAEAEKGLGRLSVAWRQIGTQRAKIKTERAELQAWQERGGRIGEFFGRLFSRASAVFSMRGRREQQLAASLQAAEGSAAIERARAEEAEAKAKRAVWEREALTKRHGKAIEEINVERLKMGKELEALKKPAMLADGGRPPSARL
jgi:hypothetical protein